MLPAIQISRALVGVFGVPAQVTLLVCFSIHALFGVIFSNTQGVLSHGKLKSRPARA
jgi:hypothetical protein